MVLYGSAPVEFRQMGFALPPLSGRLMCVHGWLHAADHDVVH
jgi:hypothetical protein